MMARRLLLLLAVAAFSMLALSRPGPVNSAGTGGEIKGTVTGIEGSRVTIRNGMGVEETVEPRNAEALRSLRVGDKASVKDGMLTKGDAEPPAPPPASGY